MHLRRLIGLSGVLSYLAVPVGLLAQVAVRSEFYGALDNAAPITRTIGGLALSVGTPYVGIRQSGGLEISSPTTQSTGFNQGPSDLVWATDADLIFGPVNARLGEGFMPYAFGGLGLESSAQPASFTDAHPYLELWRRNQPGTWSPPVDQRRSPIPSFGRTGDVRRFPVRSRH